jgi:hypothetical protein
VQALGGSGDGPFLGHGLEDPQLAELHDILQKGTSYSLLFIFNESQSVLA